ncbi:MAG: hypothetical protein ABI910_08610 [Gemmatimonadota bacterium]
MRGDTELDALLRERFARLKEDDARRTPDFAPMLAQARRSIADARPASRLRVLRWALPLAVAAGLTAIVLIPERAADREFDRLVTEWSRTSDATRHAPTDGLLAPATAGLLDGLPAIGSGIGAFRGRL